MNRDRHKPNHEAEFFTNFALFMVQELLKQFLLVHDSWWREQKAAKTALNFKGPAQNSLKQWSSCFWGFLQTLPKGTVAPQTSQFDSVCGLATNHEPVRITFFQFVPILHCEYILQKILMKQTFVSFEEP